MVEGRGWRDSSGASGRGGGALGVAFLGVFALLVVFSLVVTLTGSPSAGNPVVNLALAAIRQDAPSTDVGARPPQQARKVNGNLVADPALVEDTPEGALPAVAADGRTPREAYAGKFDLNDARPRIALVIKDLGVDPAATGLALSNLPAGVTLAFVPYAANVQSWVDRARGAGHEVLLEIPMEPFDFPESDPGPRTLLAAASPEENLKRLNWALSRFTGYVGLTNLMGARFLGEPQAVDPIFNVLAQRGLLFVDDGASPRSVTTEEARRHSLPLAMGTVVIDDVQSGASIDQKLAALELRARESGAVVGTGAPYPITIERVSHWAATLADRGYALVPVSALAKAPDAVALRAQPH